MSSVSLEQTIWTLCVILYVFSCDSRPRCRILECANWTCVCVFERVLGNPGDRAWCGAHVGSASVEQLDGPGKAEKEDQPAKSIFPELEIVIEEEDGDQKTVEERIR